MTTAEYDREVAFDATMADGDEVVVRWTNSYRFLRGRGKVFRINDRTVVVELTERVMLGTTGGWPAGHRIKVPRIGNSGWSVNNRVAPATVSHEGTNGGSGVVEMSTGGSVGKVDGVVKGLNMSVETVESVEVADQNAEATLNDEVVIEVNAEMEANIENVENDGNAIKVENLLEGEAGKPAKLAKPRPKTAKIENRTPPKVAKPVVVPTAPLAHRLSDSPTLRPALQASLGSLWTIDGNSGLFAYGRQLKKNEDFQNTDVEVLGKVPVKGSDTFVIFKHESDLEAVLKAALAAL